ncbi:MAG: dethiobiotin synthase [Parachlamydiales bacterium]
MIHNLPPYFGITGTDEGVGKTLVAAILTLGLGAGYWKPIEAGLDPWTDTEWIRQKTLLPSKHFFPERHLLIKSASPHFAAQSEGKSIALEDFFLPNKYGLSHLILEGAGGVLDPLNQTDLMVDLFSHLKLPMIVVARSGVGTLNHTLLTIRELRHKGVQILGVILNGPRDPENKKAIGFYGHVEILGEVDPLPNTNRGGLEEAFRRLAYPTSNKSFP